MTGLPRVLIVDDDPNILSALRRMLRPQRAEWDMTFIDGGEAALAAMEAEPFDVLVSDIRMPRLDGAELLSRVQRRFPGTVRVILSGYADHESVLRTVGPAHQYLAKPCDPGVIVGMIRRSIGLRRLLASAALRRTVTGLTTLPTPPELFQRLTAELASPKASAASVAEIIAADVAMTAELLKLTNSAFFSVAQAVTTPLQAVRILGFETVKALVTRESIFRQFHGAARAAPLVRALNDHSLATANRARAIAQLERLGGHVADQAFCAGMLSHVGALMLLDTDAAAYARALLRIGPETDQPSAERAALGASHCEIGAYLLGLWGFPDPVVEAVAFALRPSDSVGENMSALTCLHAACALGPGMPLVPADRRGLAARLDEAHVARFGDPDRVQRWAKMVQV